MLTQEQIKSIKEQLKSQISHLPEEKKKDAENQVDSLTPEALEIMLKQQKRSDKGIFRMIIDKEIPSRLISENPVALAVLDIKPVSKGHVIIIPKKAIKNVKNIPNLAFSLAKKVAKLLESKLKAKSSVIAPEFKFDEIVINVIPIYEKQLTLASPRYESSDSELEELENKLKKITKQKIPLIKKPVSENQVLKLKRRVP